MKFAVIGGGAAGFFGAIRAAAANPRLQVVLFEKTRQLLSKVKISGGGRCNVTHGCFDPKQLVGNYPRGGNELLGPFTRFQPQDMIDWLLERGVQLKTESDGRMFPATDSSQTIVDCLMGQAQQYGIEIRTGCKINRIEKRGARFALETAQGEEEFDKVLLATGSGRQGHEWAREFGHSVIEPVPSLFTFNVPDSPLLDLAGLSVECAQVKIIDSPRAQQGPVLITHWGFSGPAVLKLSAWEARSLAESGYRTDFTIRWVEATCHEAVFSRLLKQKDYGGNGIVGSTNLFPLPKKLWKRFLDLEGIPLEKRWSSLSKKKLSSLAQKLFADCYRMDGKSTYKQEFVTCGGVKLSEIYFKTMESRICPGLYFAGEILDVDGVTGGFNFQAAWTTSWIGGGAAAEGG